MTVRLPERRASTENGQRMTTVKCVHNSQLVIGRPSRSRMAAEGGCLRPKAVIKFLELRWLIALTEISINALRRRIQGSRL